MKKLIFSLLILAVGHDIVHSQITKPVPPRKTVAAPQNPGKKYGSLLWEITGKGMKKPSYLFGTMHVSNKLVFHLGDSFYNAIRSVDVVALETNPENWQDDYSGSSLYNNRSPNIFASMLMRSGQYSSDRMDITSLSIDKYEEAIKAALAVEPSLVNGLLYRTYGTRMADFEEDTYLDMYIFQTGKKLGKKLAGVENFKESEKLVREAYRDMMNDGKRKDKSFDVEGMYSNPKKMEEAYRKGDLDVLDSLDALEVESDAFQEKFLYKRNEIQAKNIDSILKRSSVFAAVGAAHLPGKRGVIEMLREMGYQLRPVTMDDRNSRQKETIDRIRHFTPFANQVSEDGFYEVSIPGKKFYSFTDWNGLDIRQYADMANGSYYMTVRVKTNSHFQGHSEDAVSKKIDSLLYENVPGKILKKTAITRNGYKGWEIVNRIRRGDHQRYNIFITPFEIIIFKISGSGDYIINGTEAQQFFNSVKLREYKEGNWSLFKPATGGFSVQLPYKPSLLRDEKTGSPRLEYAAHDQQNSYLVMQNNFSVFDYAEEDSFELELMTESYAFSHFIEKKLESRNGTHKGYRELVTRYLHKDGSYSSVRNIIRGPLYYTVAVKYKQENEAAKRFLNSFSLEPFVYPETKNRTDTSLRYTVESPFFVEAEKDEENESLKEMMNMFRFGDDEDENSPDLWNNTKYQVIGNDTLGEQIFIRYDRPGEYTYVKDSASLWKDGYDENNNFFSEGDSTFIIRVDKKYDLPGNIKCRDLHLSDTGSSRLIMIKYIYKNGHLHLLRTVTDTLNQSPFIAKFFNSFSPADTLKGDIFTPKTARFLNDYFSTDSATRRRARREADDMSYRDEDAPLLQNAIEKVNWKTRNYADAKQTFINSLGELDDSTNVPFLEKLYWKVKDSVDFQNAILDALLEQKTKASFTAFKELIIKETPIEAGENYSYGGSRYYEKMLRNLRSGRRLASAYLDYGYRRTWGPLYDTLELTRTIFPDILQLMNIDDYEENVLDLLVTMVDSGHLKGKDYEAWFPKLHLDAKQSLKKQTSLEDEANIEKESRKDRKKTYYDYYDEDEDMDDGNDALDKYAVLMMPFYETNPAVQGFFGQLLKTRDLELYYNTCILLLRNKKPVPDSFFTRYAAIDKYRSQLYGDLVKLKMVSKFPASFANQQAIVRSMFLSAKSSYDKPDSLTYIDYLPVKYDKDKEGLVYFFKYKEAKDDNFWYLASIGSQPANKDSIDVENDEFESEPVKIVANKPIKEQMEKMLKEMLNARRASAAGFYEARRYNPYKHYMSDIVKGNRFSD